MRVIGGAAVLGAFKALITTSIEFESAFAGVRKTVDASEADFKKLSSALREMSLRIPESAANLAKIEEIAGQLGVRGVKELTKFTETVAKIAVTTNMTKESAATDFARISNIMQEPIMNIENMASAVVELGNTTATTEAEIVSFANRIAGAGNVAGLSSADLFGFGAAFTSVGVKAERGGTAVSKALIQMQTAVLHGGDELAKFANIAGTSTAEFSEAFQTDAAGAFGMFIEGLKEQADGGVAVLNELGLADQRLIQAFLSVGGAGGLLSQSIEEANIAFEKNNALTIEAEKRFATTESQMMLLRNTMQDIAITSGEVLLPALNSVIAKLLELRDGAGSGSEDLMAGYIDGINTVKEKLRTAIAEMDDPMIAGTMVWEERAELVQTYQEKIEELQLQVTNLAQAMINDAEMIPDDAFDFVKPEYLARMRELNAELAKTKAAAGAIAPVQAKTGVVSKKLTDGEKKLEKQKQTSYMQSASTFASAAIQGFTAAEGGAKKYAGVIKAIRIGEAIMNTAAAIMSAMALAWPVNLVAAAAAAAMGAVQIGVIASQGFATGTDNVPAMLSSGEMVVPRSFASAIRSGDLALSGGGGGGDNNNVTVIMEQASFTNDQDIDEVFEEFSEALFERRRSN